MNACYVAPCNHGGEEFDSYMSGGSLICDPSGRIIVQPRRTRRSFTRTSTSEVLREARVNSGLKDRRPDLYGPVLRRWRSCGLP